jgi:hypothetical protein
MKEELGLVRAIDWGKSGSDGFDKIMYVEGGQRMIRRERVCDWCSKSYRACLSICLWSDLDPLVPLDPSQVE